MKILHIDCSPRRHSHSRELSAAIVGKLQASAHDTSIVRRDLGHDPIPHATPDYAHALSTPAAAQTETARAATDLSEILISEVEASDVIVLGTPMNNYTVPSVLKAWIDQLLRVGRSIIPTDKGKVGALQNRPVYVAIASGGVFMGKGANQPDFLTPYLSAAFDCVGIKDLRFLAVQATAFLTDEQAALAKQEALASLDMTSFVGQGKPLANHNAD